MNLVEIYQKFKDTQQKLIMTLLRVILVISFIILII